MRTACEDFGQVRHLMRLRGIGSLRGDERKRKRQVNQALVTPHAERFVCPLAKSPHEVTRLGRDCELAGRFCGIASVAATDVRMADQVLVSR